MSLPESLDLDHRHPEAIVRPPPVLRQHQGLLQARDPLVALPIVNKH